MSLNDNKSNLKTNLGTRQIQILEKVYFERSSSSKTNKDEAKVDLVVATNST
jgi:hypothetical protein